jgi:hypothetical protein
MEPEAFAAAVAQVIESNRRVQEAAAARNEDRAAARSLGGVERARAAKRRELEALNQAVDLHELAAQLNEGLGRSEQAAAARDRADRARLAMVEAVRESNAAEALVARRHRRLARPSRDVD